MVTSNRTPTIQEYLDMVSRKDELTAETESLEIQLIGQRASVDYLRHIEHDLRVAISNVCYDMSKLLDLTGKLADTERTQLWPQIQNTVANSDKA